MATDNIRGVFFDRKIFTQNCLAIILSCINVTDYLWQVSNYDAPENGEDLGFDCDQISGEELYNEIKNSYGNVIFAEILGFKLGREMVDIDNYNDYLKSPCEIALFCSDSWCYEIYCKDQRLTDLIMQTLNKGQLGKTEYITDSNDGRTSFHVW